MINSTMSLIGNPIKISGVRDLIHKYNNYFFDLDGVIVTINNLSNSGKANMLLRVQFKH